MITDSKENKFQKNRVKFEDVNSYLEVMKKDLKNIIAGLLVYRAPELERLDDQVEIMMYDIKNIIIFTIHNLAYSNINESFIASQILATTRLNTPVENKKMYVAKILDQFEFEKLLSHLWQIEIREKPETSPKWRHECREAVINALAEKMMENTNDE